MTDEQRIKISELRSKGYGYKKIAQLTGESENTVKSYCKRLKQVEEAKQQIVGERICLCCGQPVQQMAKRKEKKFCSDSCRMRWWNSHLDRVNRKANRDVVCQCCGKTFTAYGSAERKYCGRDCYIKGRFGGKENE